MSHILFKSELFYCESVEYAETVELKLFKPLFEEENLAKYLRKFAKVHEHTGIERTYIVRDIQTDVMVGWFSMQTSTLPYQNKDSNFHIPAIELTNFAIDKIYKKNHKDEFINTSIGMHVFFSFVEPIAYSVAKLVGCQDIYVFALNKLKLLDYYKNKLGFRALPASEDFIQLPNAEYSKNLVFLYKPLDKNIADFPQLKIF